MDEWDQFPDADGAPPAAAAQPSAAAGPDPWAEFPDAEQAAAEPVAPAPEPVSAPNLRERLMAGIDSKYNPFRYGIFGGTGEAVANLATGSVAAPVSGLAGLAAAPFGHGAEAVESVGGALTYQPRTQAGQQVQGVISKPFEMLARGADVAGDVAMRRVPSAGGGPATSYSPGSGGWPMAGREPSPAMAAGINTGIQALPGLALRGPKAKAGAAAVPKPKPQLSPRDVAAQKAREAGFNLTSDQAGGAVGKTLEGIAGRAQLEREHSMRNAPRVNELAAEEIGLPAGTKAITKGDLARLKVEANRPYNELASTGTRKVSNDFRQEVKAIGDKSGGKSFEGDTPPEIARLKEFYSSRNAFDAQDAVNKIRTLRRDGNANKSGKYDPEKAALGDVQLKIADALDNELQRHAESLGRPELVTKYKEARVQLAKLHTVESALRGTDVSALALARAQKNGAPLSGKLKTIADSATEFEKSFQEVRKVRSAGPLGVADYLVGVGGAAASPALAAAVLARPAIRAALGSNAFQRRFIGPREAGPPAAASPLAPKANALATSTADRRRKAG